MSQSELVPATESAVFDLNRIARAFPENASTMLIDTRLTDEVEASSRVFRIYTRVPAHYHTGCDEYLLVLSGRALFLLEGREPFELGPGELVFFKKGTIHGTAELLEEPFVVFSVDTPRRDPRDIVFVNSEDGTPEKFIQSQRLY